ncbi:MAG: sodium:alanine symporter [Candidatus Lambdaproteobacteria bacterium RIFOXYD2_FULL_50_16]|uniref:Sodium:alanine symporter n=1 Tax=Candidatus Lambdaproteobacteria bacterium RIFOXYD2_FULL_50_16 TaxID=1817772 RepID=A0A1F6GFE0_9PROT|nr:MAG: sodium:alanine symporter [Candidatus Lambdaproteobacteria bacterium RIFOXYD2_FULL_50_16]
MEVIEQVVGWLNGLVWGPLMLVLILGTGLYLMAGLKGFPLRNLGRGFGLLWAGRKGSGQGDITPWGALMTALAATIGTGNIAGVATAIFLGGPGALFWMWCTALLGMATSYSEAVLAVKYREVDQRGEHVGGPMYYIRKGLSEAGPLWAKPLAKPLGLAFAFFAIFAGFGIGNGVQANSVAAVLYSSLQVPFWVSGLVMAVLVGLVLLGGIKRIAQVSSKLVPLMAILYVGGGLVIIALNIGQVPGVLALIFTEAFSPTAAQGGFAGATIWMGMRYGVARGVFSNEAGLGSAPIAHAAAKTEGPVTQGMVAMLGCFIDTILVCTVTGLVILITGAWTSGQTGSALSALAFEAGIGVWGTATVTIGLVLFAFTTLIGWSFYGEKAAEFLFGERSILPYRIAWVLMVPVGALVKLDFIWLLADTLNALMAIPNLIALGLLGPLIFKLTRERR